MWCCGSSVIRSWLFFFFSSRRRHTRYIGDWSSDVCSSDLLATLVVQQILVALDEEQPRDGALVRRPRHEPAGELGELLTRSHLEGVGVLHELSRPASRRAVQLVEAVLLAREMAVDRPLRHARLLRDLWRSGLVIAVRGEELERRSLEPLAGEVGLGHRWRI